MEKFIDDEQIGTQNEYFDHTININGTNKIVHDEELDLHTKNISILDETLNRLANTKISIATNKLAYTAFAVGAAVSWAGVTVNQILSNLEPQLFNYLFFPGLIGIAAIQTLKCNKAGKLCNERAFNVMCHLQEETEKYKQRKEALEKQQQNLEFSIYK